MIMKHIFIGCILVLLVAGCGRQEHMVLPSPNDIRNIHVFLPPFDQFGLTTNAYTIDNNRCDGLLALFASAHKVHCTSKWLSVGKITIATTTGDSLAIDLYFTRHTAGFYLNGKYYTGSSDKALVDAIKQAVIPEERK